MPATKKRTRSGTSKKTASRAASKKRTVSKKKTSKKSTSGPVRNKIHKVMKEFKEGALHTRSKKGPKVRGRKQAIAIALSEAGVSRNQSKRKSSAKRRSR